MVPEEIQRAADAVIAAAIELEKSHPTAAAADAVQDRFLAAWDRAMELGLECFVDTLLGKAVVRFEGQTIAAK